MPYADPEKQREYFRQYDAKRNGTEKRKKQNLEKTLRWRDKQDRTALRAKWSAEKRAVYSRDREKICAKEKARRDRDPKAHHEKKQAARSRNIDRYRELDRATYARHADKKRARRRRYASLNRGKVREQLAACRAKRRAVPTGDTQAIRAFYKHVEDAELLHCYYCNRPLPKGKRTRHVDHKHPLAKQGPHCVTNLAVACQPCNQHKHAMTEEQFRAYLAKNGGMFT
jgi:hypothetical protein